MKIRGKYNLIVLAMTVMAAFLPYQTFAATYVPQAVAVSADLLSGTSASAIANFHYNLASLPAGSSVRLQFSKDNAGWYSAAGASGEWTTISAIGGADLDLAAFVAAAFWASGDSFYYKLELNATPDLTQTPAVEDIRLDYTPAAGYEKTFIFDDYGRVGIGTTAPWYTLDVNGTINADFYRVGGVAALGTTGGKVYVGSAADYDFGIYAGAADRLFIQNSTGNVGIGTTSPGSLLHLNGALGALSGGLAFGDGDTGLYENYDDNFRLQTAGVDRITIDDTGNVGIGTTAPSGLLHVAGGQCVTGDTLLRVRRRRKRQNERGEWIEEEYFEDCRIDQVKAGDEILTLDENTGRLAVSRVNALMDMGVKEIYKLTTATGKTIRTTANHPYLAVDGFDNERVAVFVDSANFEMSCRFCGLEKDYVKMDKFFFGTMKKSVKTFRFYKVDFGGNKQRKFFDFLDIIGAKIVSKPIKVIKQKQKANEHKANFDVELAVDAVELKEKYDMAIIVSGDSDFAYLAEHLQKAGKKTIVISPWRRTGKELRQQADMYFDLRNMPFVGRIKIKRPPVGGINPGFSPALTILSQVHPFVKGAGKWKKVSDLREGQMIAVVGDNGKPQYERIAKIEKLPPEQVYDIEVEGTHNFVGNGIVAHNTYLQGADQLNTSFALRVQDSASADKFVVTNAGNVGIGTTAPGDKLHIAMGANSGGLTITGKSDNTVEGQLGYINGSGTFLWMEKEDGTLTNLIRSYGNSYFNSGNVGIGTTSPAEALDVNGRVRLAQTTAPETIADKLYNVSGNLVWSGVNLTAGGALPSGAEGQLLYNNAGAWSAFSGLYWDDTNSRLGIGTTTPGQALSVNGDQTVSGYLRVGSNSAPAANQSGDLTANYLALGTDAASGFYGRTLYSSYTNTDTAAGSFVMAGFNNVIAPLSNSSSEYRAINFQNILNAASGITYNKIRGGNFENRVRGDGLVTELNGVKGVGLVLDSSSAATAQATNVYGFNSSVYSRPSGSSTATIGLGVGYDTASLAPNSGLTINTLTGFRMYNPVANAITNLIGLDIADLTQGTNNYGIRSAVSSGENKYNLYLSGTANNYIAGNVGIGTTSPGQKLTIQGDSGLRIVASTENHADQGVRLMDLGGDTAGGMKLTVGNGDAHSIWLRGDSTTGMVNNYLDLVEYGLIRFFTGITPAERMRIDNTGNVGIGTTSPGQKLEIAGASGNTMFSGNDIIFTRAGRNYIYASDAAGDFGFGTGGRATDLTISTAGLVTIAQNLVVNGAEDTTIAGNVGIGTTSPGSKLTVRGATAYTSTSDAATLLKLESSLDQYPTFPGATVGLQLNPRGTVGENMGNRIVSEYSSDSYRGYDLHFQVTTAPGVWANLMKIDGITGNVGIGTTVPSMKLDVNGNVNGGVFYGNRFSAGDGTVGAPSIYFSSDGDNGLRYLSSNAFSLVTGGADALTLSAGNVGIGTTSPGYALDVNGGFRVGNATSTAGIVFDPSTGNVGIGTAAPVFKFQVQADGTGIWAGDNGNGQLVLSGSTDNRKRLAFMMDTTNNVGVIQAGQYMAAAYPLALNPAGGNVGIGTTAPAAGYKLDVAGNINSAQTVNQETYPSINASQTASDLQDGSAFTGTDATMATMYQAVQFTASDAHTMGDFTVRVKESADITNTTQYLIGYIYADDGGSPSKPGALLATGISVRFGTLTTSYQILSMGTSYTMVSGTKYWLVLKYSAAPTGGNIILDSDASSNMGATSADGTSWTNTNVRLRYVIRGRTYYGGNFFSTNNFGVRGLSTNSFGVYGNSTNSYGIYGSSTNNYGIYGLSANNVGVYGGSTNGYGVYGNSTNSAGVYGSSTNYYGGNFFSVNSTGAVGSSTNGYGVVGTSTNNIAGYLYINPATTNTVGEVLRLRRQTSGTAADGIGGSMDFYTEDSAGTDELTGRIGNLLTTATSGSETSALTFWTRTGGAALAEALRIDGAGNVGIGTIAPTSRFTVRGDSSGAVADLMRLENLGTAAANSGVGLQFIANRTTGGATEFGRIDMLATGIGDTDYSGAFQFKIAANGLLETVAEFGNPNIVLNRPLQVNVAGDTGISYDLQFMSAGNSHITSNGPLTIAAGNINRAQNLVLTTQSNEQTGDFGTAATTTATTLTDSDKAWTVDEWIGGAVTIISGAGRGQTQTITDNDATSITVADWDAALGDPAANSVYRLSYAPGGDILMNLANSNNIFGGFKILGNDNGGYAFRVAPDGNVYVGGEGAAGSNLFVKQNITSFGGILSLRQLDISSAGTPAATTATSGGSCADSTAYYYKVTAVNDNGETTGTAQFTVTTGASGTNINLNTIAWSAVTGATGYKIYRSTENNDWDGDANDQWVDGKVVAAPAITYDDDCAGDTASLVPPTANTTGGKLAINTAGVSPTRRFEVLENTGAAPQMKIISDSSNYSEFYVDATGDLSLKLTGSGGDDLILLDENLKICASGDFGSVSCPTAGFTISGTGNLIVENKVIADKFEQICPTGYVWVPGSAKHGTLPGFCVMKYEAKDAGGGVAESKAADAPWTSVTQENARAYCQALGEGYHLVSEAEWMTIAENIAATPINDIDAVAGLQLATGHTDNDPANSLAAGTDPVVSGCNLRLPLSDAANAFAANCQLRDSGAVYGYSGTGNQWADTGYSAGGNNKSQLRVHALSNGNTVWDIAGNVWEWTDAIISQVDQPDIGNDGGATVGNWGEWNVARYLIGAAANSRPPDDGWTAANGIGRLWTYGRDETASTTYRAFLRGGDWSSTSYAGVFALYLSNSPAGAGSNVGFRCAR